MATESRSLDLNSKAFEVWISYNGPWARLPLRRALDEAARILAESAWSRGILTVSPLEARSDVLYAIEAVARVAGLEGRYLRVQLSPFKGLWSQYLLLVLDDEEFEFAVASLGPGGVATAAIYDSSLWSDFHSFPNEPPIYPKLDLLAGLPVRVPILSLQNELRAGNQRALYCRVNDFKDVELAHKLQKSMIVNALIEAMESLQRASEEESCDIAGVLRSLGWHVVEEARDAGNRLTATYSLEGDEFAVGLKAKRNHTSIRSYIYDDFEVKGISVGLVEACGSVVKLKAESNIAYFIPHVGECKRPRGRAAFRIGVVTINIKARGPVIVCHIFDNIDIFYSRIGKPSATKLGSFPFLCCKKGRGIGVNMLVGGPARIRASLGGLMEEVEVPEGMLSAILVPLASQSAAVAAPSGEVEVIPGDRLRGVEILDPGY